MNRSLQPEDKQPELTGTYFYDLIRNRQAKPPRDLDETSAELLRQLVETEREAASAATPLFAEARARIWEQIVNQSQTQPAQPNVNPALTRGTLPASMQDEPQTAELPRLHRWGRRTLLATMAATVVLVAGLITLLVLASLDNQPTPQTGAGPSTTSPTTISSKPVSQGRAYEFTLQPLGATSDLKQLEIARQVLEKRLQAFGLSQVKAVSKPNQIVAGVGGVTDLEQITNLLTERGRVEIILVDNETFKDGELVQTSFCLKGSLTQNTAGTCTSSPAGEKGRLNSSGQPFQTLFASDDLGPAPGKAQNTTGLEFLAMLNKLRDKISQNFSGKSAAIVVDGRVFQAVQLTNLFSKTGDVGLTSAATAQGQTELTLLKALLVGGMLPFDLKLVSSQPL